MTTTTSPVLATFVGGPTLLLRYAGLTFLTDPTFDAAPAEYPLAAPAGRPLGVPALRKLVGPAVSVDALGPVDAVLLSHDQHADNLDRAGRALLAGVPLVLSTPAAAGRIDGVRGLEPWAETVLTGPHGDVVVTAVPARHGPEGAPAVSGDVTGFVLRAEGERTVYVSGDNASVDVVATVAQRFPDIEVAVLFVGGTNTGRFGDEPMTLDAARAAAVAELLPSAVVVPVHHSDWAHMVDPLDAVVARFEAGGRSQRLHVLDRGVETPV